MIDLDDPQPKEARGRLHQALLDKGLYTKGPEEFDTQFSADSSRQKLYDALSESGDYTKSYDEFETQFFDDLKKKDEPQPDLFPGQVDLSKPIPGEATPIVSENGSSDVNSTPLEEQLKTSPPVEQAQPGFGNQRLDEIEEGLRKEMEANKAPAMALPKDESINAFDRPSQLQVTPSKEQLAENQFEAKKDNLKNLIRDEDKAKMADSLQKYSGTMITKIDEGIENIYKDAKEKGVYMGGGPQSSFLPNDNEHKQKIAVLSMAKDIMEQVKDTPDQGGFLAGLTSKGAAHLLPFVGGLEELPKISKIQELSKKASRTDNIQDPMLKDMMGEHGDLSKEERTLLTADQIQKEFEAAKENPSSYRWGQVMGSMLPYIGEYALTAGAYTGAKALAVTGLKKVLKSSAEKAIVKNGVIKPVSTLLGIVAQTSANPQQYVATTLQRMTPQMRLAMDQDENQIKAIGSGFGLKKGESFEVAFAKAFGTTAMENLTERFGQWSNEAADAIKKAGYWLPQLTLGRWMEKRGIVDMAKAKEAAHRIGWDGVIQEVWLEEYPNKILQNAITGDEKWTPDFFNPLSQEFTDMVIPSLLLSGGPLAAGAAHKYLSKENQVVTPEATIEPKGQGDVSAVEKLTADLKNEKPKEQPAAVEPKGAVPEVVKETTLPAQETKKPAEEVKPTNAIESMALTNQGKEGDFIENESGDVFRIKNKVEGGKEPRYKIEDEKGNEFVVNTTMGNFSTTDKTFKPKEDAIPERPAEKVGTHAIGDEGAGGPVESSGVGPSQQGAVPAKEEAPPPSTDYSQKQGEFEKLLTDKGVQPVAAKLTAKSLVKSLTDRETALKVLHTENKNMRDIWSKETGITLPKTESGTQKIINEYFNKKEYVANGNTPVAKTTPQSLLRDMDKEVVEESTAQFAPIELRPEMDKLIPGFKVITAKRKGDLKGKQSPLFKVIVPEGSPITVTQDWLNPAGLTHQIESITAQLDKLETKKPAEKPKPIVIPQIPAPWSKHGAEPAEAFIPKDQWDKHLIKAREYANALGIGIEGKDLPQLVREINTKIAPKKSEAKKAHIKDLFSELDELVAPGRLNMVAEHDKDRANKIAIKGAEIVAAYVDLGITRFSEIAREIYQDHGEPALRKFLDAIKQGYGRVLATAENIDEFDDIKTIRSFTADNLIESFKEQDNDNGDRENAVPGSGRPSGSTTVSDAGGQAQGTQPGEAPGGKETDGGDRGLVPGQTGDVQNIGDEPAGSSPHGDVGSLQPESLDADVQQNFVYPENWERNKNKTFSKRQAYADNITALTIINDLLDSDRFATDVEKLALAKYNGLGPLGEILLPDDKSGWNKSSLEFYDEAHQLKRLLNEIGKKTNSNPLDTAKSSTLNAYYTSMPIIRAIWQGLSAAKVNGGKILEGSVGSGRFIGGMPSGTMSSSRVTGVDMDVVSSLIAKYLYPKASIINSPLQQASIPSNSFDLFISNIPFGSAKVYDPVIDKKGPAWKESQGKLHTYFFAKAIDVVRPGGYVAILTTSNVLDTPGNKSTRDLINRETEFIGAVRLPASAFNSDAGTQVVTDIIFLRKRIEEPKGKVTSQISDITTKEVPHNNPALPAQEIQYNEYFKKNPKNLFGTEFKAGGMYAADSGYTLEGEVDPKAVGKRLAEMATEMPILDRPVSEEETRRLLQITSMGRMVSGGIVKHEGSFFHVLDYDAATGKSNIEEIKKTVMPSAKDMPILEEFLDIKNTYFNILGKDKLGQDATNERKELKKLVDTFLKTIKPGTLGSLGNGNKAVNRLLVADPDFYAITALQKPDGALSDIIEKPVKSDLSELTHTDSPVDAIGYSINNFGKINLPFIQKVLGASSEGETKKIIDSEIFELLDGDVVERTEYLSGNVREKLSQAKEWEQTDTKFKKNVEALTKVIPEDLPTDQITFQVGASWIPLSYTTRFLEAVFGEGNVEVKYTKATDDYNVTTSVIGGEYEANGDGHTRRVDVVIKAALTKNVPDFYHTHSDGSRTPLPRLTQDVRDKAERLQAEFSGLVDADEHMRTELSRLYNDLFNAIVLKVYDGSKLTFPGMQGFELNPHQKDAIMLLIHRMGGMIDHIVGAGKSVVMSVGAIKMKQLGLINKPMITTMKSVLPGMIAEAKRQYPDAKILAPKESDFSASNIQRIFAQIANNDWDLIIVTHENLGKIPMPPEFEAEFVENEIAELVEALDEISANNDGDAHTKKQLKAIQEKILNLKARLQKIQDKGKHASRTDFGTMGIDMLFVDESQQFKNLSFISKLRRVAGLGTAKGSQRASNLKMVSRYLQKMHGGDKGIAFASGTPISNSLVEVYNIFQYLRPSLLRKLGMVSLDQFLKNFGKIESILEKNIAGVVKAKTRLSGFVNVADLAGMYSEISDVRGIHNLKLPRPEIEDGKPELIMIPQSETVKKITTAIYKASDTKSIGPLEDIGIYPQGDAEKAIGLVLTTLGKKASIDPRLVYPGTKADGGKTFAITENVYNRYQKTKDEKGVQLIFSDMGTPKKKAAPIGTRLKDEVIEAFGENYIEEFSRAEEVWKQKDESQAKAKLIEVFELDDSQAQELIDSANDFAAFNVYEELKKQLIGHGIPSSEIAFIHDAPTKKLKEELFRNVNAGKIRVLIGSTMMMGTGVNVQERVVAMHHVDIGWRPSDQEQRNGRGIRRGNKNAVVGIKYYGTEQTIDGYMFGLVARKQHDIDTFRAGAKGIREMDFEDGESMTMGEMAAAISGDTRMLDLEKLKGKVNKLRNRIESAKRANVLRERRIQEAKRMLDRARLMRDASKNVAERLKANVSIQEIEEEQPAEAGKKSKITKVPIAVFKGKVNGREYDTSIKEQRNKFYEEVSKNVNDHKNSRYSMDRELVGEIGGVPIYTIANGVPSDKAVTMRIDLGEENWEGIAPISLVNFATLITPNTLRQYVIPTVRDAEIVAEKNKEHYEGSVVLHEKQKATPEVFAKDKDVQELEELTVKRDALRDDLKKEADANMAPKPEEEDTPDDEPPAPKATATPKTIEDAITDVSKLSGETHQPFRGAMATGIPLPVVGKSKVTKSNKDLLNLVQQNHLSQAELEKELDRQIQPDDADVAKRMDDASAGAKPNMAGTVLQNLKDWLSGFRSHYKYLSEKGFPREANILREFEGLKVWANGQATIYVKGVVEPLTPQQYKILSYRIILADMLGSIKQGLNMTGLDGKLPFGFNSQAEVERNIQKYDDFISADPKLKKAYDARQDFMDIFKESLLSAGLLSENEIEDYYHRRVLAYQSEDFANDILFGKTMGDKKRDFQKSRSGTRGLDYSTNFIETEFKVVAEGLFELEKQKQLKDLMEPYEKELKALTSKFDREFNKESEDLKQKFGDNSPEVQVHELTRRDMKKKFLTDNIPEGYVFYRVSEENRLFWGKTITEKALNNTIEAAQNQVPVNDVVDELLNSIGTGLMVGAKRKQYMVPKPIAEQLEEMSRDEVVHPGAALLSEITSEWKKLMLLSPFRFFRYNLNNLGGDIDRTLQIDAEILKYGKEAASELWDFTHYGNVTPELAQAMRGNVVDSGFEISELADLSKQEWATHFFDRSGGPSAQDIFGKQWMKDMALSAVEKPGSMYDQYMQWAGKYARLRENVLRFAAYKLALEKQAKGEKFYWASRKSSIDAITDTRQKVAKLAREAYGDYGNISYSGKALRKYAIPFYSWLEINMGTNLRLLKNANSPAVQKAMMRSAIMRGIPGMAVRVALANMKVLLFTAMVQAWNRFLFPLIGDDDDDVAERLRRSNMKGMHILISYDPETGHVRGIPTSGAFYDFVDFFGIPGAISDVERMIIGKGGPMDILKTVGAQMLNRSVQMVNPAPKIVAELAGKKSYFPDIANPIPFDDRWEYLANIVTLKDEYNHFLSDKPQKESYLARKWNNSLLIREFDPETLAYYQAKRIISDYTGKKEGSSDPTNPNEIAKKRALDYYALSLRYNHPEEATKYLIEYYMAGGTANGLQAKINSTDPFKGLSKTPKMGEAVSEFQDIQNAILIKGYEPTTYFGKQLSPDELSTMRDAMRYYNRSKGIK